MAIQLIVGLQNPGSKYARTRHNVGGWYALALAKAYNTQFVVDKRSHGEVANLLVSQQPCIILLPSTYMNESGLAVRAAARIRKLDADQILVIHDDLDLPAGRIKLKTGGGHGGHNGLRDIIQQLGSNNFHRLRIGIGHPGYKELVLDYVLSPPTLHEREEILQAIETGIAVLPDVVSGNMALAMNKLHS